MKDSQLVMVYVFLWVSISKANNERFSTTDSFYLIVSKYIKGE